MTNAKDTIHVSLGASANAVSAHLLNLYGLAATGDDAFCDASVTHGVEHNYRVPRAFMLDEPTGYPALPEPFVDQQREQLLMSTQYSVQQGMDTAQANDAVAAMQYHDQSSDAFANFFQTSSILAYSAHSRFYQPPSSQPTYKADPSNSRHVNWDDDDEGEEDEETDEERRQRLHRQRSQWQTQTAAPMQQQLDHHWGHIDKTDLTWVDFLMPPYSRRLKLALPYSRQSNIAAHWDHYTASADLGRWNEDVLMESIRHQLEESDYCQGFVIATEGYGIYAGLATTVLQEVSEECRSAGRLVFHITNPVQQSNGNGNSDGDHDNDKAARKEETSGSTEDDPSAWRANNVRKVQSGIQSGVALHGLTQSAHVVLPLRLQEGIPLFESSARLAMHLESITLPYRLNAGDNHRYKIGLQNARFFGQGGMDTGWGSTAQRLSFGEFITSLQPSSAFPLIELDAMQEADATKDKDIAELFKIGTTVARDDRMRQANSDSTSSMRSRRSQNVAPGGWLNSTKHGGVLSSMSQEAEHDRSGHSHFAIASAFRPTTRLDASVGVPQTLTCIMEGTAVRHRPERSISTVVDQSVLGFANGGYGTGTYWKSILSQKPKPVLSIASNTTRSYFMIDKVATEMKTVLGRKYKGFYNREITNGVLPESEDCDEALASCLDLRDAYTPPGIHDDDDGAEDF